MRRNDLIVHIQGRSGFPIDRAIAGWQIGNMHRRAKPNAPQASLDAFFSGLIQLVTDNIEGIDTSSFRIRKYEGLTPEDKSFSLECNAGLICDIEISSIEIDESVSEFEANQELCIYERVLSLNDRYQSNIYSFLSDIVDNLNKIIINVSDELSSALTDSATIAILDHIDLKSDDFYEATHDQSKTIYWRTTRRPNDLPRSRSEPKRRRVVRFPDGHNKLYGSRYLVEHAHVGGITLSKCSSNGRKWRIVLECIRRPTIYGYSPPRNPLGINYRNIGDPVSNHFTLPFLEQFSPIITGVYDRGPISIVEIGSWQMGIRRNLNGDIIHNNGPSNRLIPDLHSIAKSALSYQGPPPKSKWYNFYL